MLNPQLKTIFIDGVFCELKDFQNTLKRISEDFSEDDKNIGCIVVLWDSPLLEVARNYSELTNIKLRVIYERQDLYGNSAKDIAIDESCDKSDIIVCLYEFEIDSSLMISYYQKLSIIKGLIYYKIDLFDVENPKRFSSFKGNFS